MNKTKTLFILLAVFCVFSFAACGGEFDPVAYVEGTLEADLYGNITKDYIDQLADTDSADELENRYSEDRKTYAESFIGGMGIMDPDTELIQNTADMLGNVFAACKTEVTGEYTEGSNGEYYVEVIAYPLLTFYDVINDKDGSLSAALAEAYSEDMTYNDLMILSLEYITEAVNTALEEPTYGDPVTFDLKVSPNGSGYYSLDPTEYEEFKAVLLDM